MNIHYTIKNKSVFSLNVKKMNFGNAYNPYIGAPPGGGRGAGAGGAGRGGRGGRGHPRGGAGGGRANAAALNADPRGRIRGGNNALLRNRTWMITWRNHFPPHDLTGQIVPGTNSTVDYMVGQMEMGQVPGRNNDGLHWQGYMEFSQDVTGPQILDLFMANFATGPDRLWLEPRFGSQQDAINYVTKEETRHTPEHETEEDFGPVEYGTRHQADAAGVWQNMRRAIINGAQMKHFLADEQLFATAFRCPNGLKAMIEARDDDDPVADNVRDLKVILYYGEPGTGKSGGVHRWCEQQELALFEKPREASLHWTGYNKEPVLLLEEFGNPDNPITPGDAQKILDKYPFRLKQMYGKSKARWSYVFICTNVPPDQWYQRAHPTVKAAIMRRIHEIWRFTQDAVYLEKGPGEFVPIPDPEAPRIPNIIRNPIPFAQAVDNVPVAAVVNNNNIMQNNLATVLDVFDNKFVANLGYHPQHF